MFKKTKLFSNLCYFFRGKTPEWYNKTYGHISSHNLLKIRNAFKSVADAPEGKV